MLKCGMYTDGRTVVTVIDVCNGDVSYVQGYFSPKHNDDYSMECSLGEFTRQYPYPITEVVVQRKRKSKEEKPIGESQYYTDGKVVVFVIEVAPRYVYFYRDHPFAKGEQQLVKKTFRSRFPYTVVGVTLE